MNAVKAVVLAAGKGTRLHSSEHNSPKVMRLANEKPLLHYVLSALDFIKKEDITIVVGYMAEQVTAAFPEYKSALQEEQLGTGHAVMAARQQLEGFDGTVLVCYGDMPLLKKETYEALLAYHYEHGNICTILTGTSTTYLPYGRVVRDENGDFSCVVEDRDCTPQQKEIKELNAGIYAFDCAALLDALTKLRSDTNVQKEYYLTDAPQIILSEGGKVGACCVELNEQILGVNTPEDLALVEKCLRER